MEETNKTGDRHEQVTRSELFELYKHYELTSNDRLSFCYQFQYFYIAMLAAFLAGGLTALLTIKPGDTRGLFLLIVPLLTIIFARVANVTVLNSYRRFVEAWVTFTNLQSMLYSENIDLGDYTPAFRSKDKGLLPSIFFRSRLFFLPDYARTEGWEAEKVVHELYNSSDTRRLARYTYLSFITVAIMFSISVILLVFFSLF